MCQHNDRRIHRHAVKCFRVYVDDRYTENLVSYYNNYLMPRLNTTTEAKHLGKPFHAFRTTKAVEKWLKCGFAIRSSFKVFECELTGQLKGGVWDDMATHTYTGQYLRVIRKVGSYVRGSREIIWQE